MGEDEEEKETDATDSESGKKEQAEEGEKESAEEEEEKPAASEETKEGEEKEEEEEEGKEEEEEYIPQYRERKRKFKHDLLVSESDNPIVQMTNAEILASKGKLEKLH